MFPVFPTLSVRGWDGVSDTSSLARARVLPSVDAFVAPQTTDAMFVAYTVPRMPRAPRLVKAAATVLKAAGQPPRMAWLVADIDRVGHVPWDTAEQAEEHILGLLDENDGDVWFDAANYYTTRAGYRLLWRLETTVEATKHRALAEKMVARLAAAGVAVDAQTLDWTRLYRLPRAKRDGAVLESQHCFDALKQGLLLDPFAFGELADEDELTYFESRDVPDPLEWDAETALRHERAATQFKDKWVLDGRPVPPWHQEHGKGSRYVTLRKALSSIAFEGQITDPEVLLQLVRKSVEATDADTTVDLSEAWRLCQWMAAKEAGKQRNREAHAPTAAATTASAPLADATQSNAGVVQTLEAPTASTPGLTPTSYPRDPEPIDSDTWAQWLAAVDGRHRTQVQKLQYGAVLDRSKPQYDARTVQTINQLAKGARIEDATLLFRAAYASAQTQTQPSAAQLWTYCQDAAGLVAREEERRREIRKDREAFRHKYPLTVQVLGGGKVFYQLDTRREPYTYRDSSRDSLLMHFNRRTRPGLSFPAEYTNSNGQMLSVPEILDAYGATVMRVVYLSGMSGATFHRSDDGNALHVGIHALTTKVQPVFHEDIDQWLQLVGGDNADTLLDWLATVTMLDRPTCALYLNGPPGIGKSLLGEGIARLWEALPVSYETVGAAFNEDMLRCPLVFADEGIASERGKEHRDGKDFRNLVANSSHKVSIKNKNTADIEGCFRVLVCANGEYAIDFREELERDGLDAIVQRVAYLPCDGAARAYLNELGGRQHTQHWVARPDRQPGLIAEHLLWLRDNRPVEHGQRFLVEGQETAWHRSFIRQQGMKPDVLRVVAKLALLAAGGQPTPSVVRLHPSNLAVFVTAPTVADAWETYGRGKEPSNQRLRQTLGALGEKDRPTINGDRLRGYWVPLQQCVEAGFATWGALKLETQAREAGVYTL